MARLLARSLLIFGCYVSFLGMLATVPASTAQTIAAQLETSFVIPNSNGAKFPGVATFEDQVYVAANPGERAVIWSKQDAASAFADRTELGFASGQADYSPANVATGSDGSAYVTWYNDEDNAIFLRKRAANSPTWGNTITVRRGGILSPGAVNLSIGVASDGKIFVVWRETDRPFRYTVSSNGGATWSSPANLTEFTGYNAQSSVATGSNGSVLVAITVTEGDFIQVYAAIWNGSGFDYSRVSQPGTIASNPTATIGGSGTLYVAWRGSPKGVFYATRQPNGTWALSRLADIEVYGAVAISADSQDNLHMFWVGLPPGSSEMTYAFKSAGGEWQGPIRVPPAAGEEYFNAQGASTLSISAFGHGVIEQFRGRSLDSRYFLFSGGPGSGVIGAIPKIEGDQAIVRGKTALTVNFENVAGEPTQVRWNWGAPPTDAASDSNGWQAFSNPLNVGLPPGVNTALACRESTLYTQVRNSNTIEANAKSDTATLDLDIQGTYRAVNPYTTDKLGTFTPMASPNQAELAVDLGASHGDPDYTRAPIFYLEIVAETDCSGLLDFTIGKNANEMGLPFPLAGNKFANMVPFPDAGNVQPGQVDVLIRIRDKVGNVKEDTRTFFYDTTKPKLDATTAGSFNVASQPDATILTTLTFEGINVTDNMYRDPISGRQFWGVWVANSRTPISNPTDPASPLVWTALAAPSGSGNSFTLANWSLASHLVGEVGTGTYYVYVRFLDGAGWPTDGYLATEVTVDQLTFPTLRLPVIQR